MGGSGGRVVEEADLEMGYQYGEGEGEMGTKAGSLDRSFSI